jgi:two-component system, LuxR family, response regulator FixJ
VDSGILIQVSAGPADAASDDVVAAKPGSAAELTRTDQMDRQGPVCVVDDDNWVCDSLSILLETYGFGVRTYPSGTAFLTDEARRDASCLIVDQHMPGLGGLDLVAELRRREVALPTILITGRLDAAISRRATDLGVLAILEKPFPVARLLELVRMLGPQAPYHRG